MSTKKTFQQELEKAVAKDLPVRIEFKFQVGPSVLRALYGMAQMIQNDQFKEIKAEHIELMRNAHERGAWAGRQTIQRTVEFTPGSNFDVSYFMSWVEPGARYIAAMERPLH